MSNTANKKLLQDKKLYIFDWDGTIMDSINHIVASIQKAAKTFGDEISSDKAKDIIGLALPEAIAVLFPQHVDKTDIIISMYKKNYVGTEANTPLYDGIETLIPALQAQGKLVAVATGKARDGLDIVLEKSKLGDYFAATRGADETKSKPDPLMLQEILEQTGVDVADAVMIGDTSYDLEMAQNMGMDSIGVTYGVHTQETLEKYQPKAIVHTAKELAALIV